MYTCNYRVVKQASDLEKAQTHCHMKTDWLNNVPVDRQCTCSPTYFKTEEEKNTHCVCISRSRKRNRIKCPLNKCVFLVVVVVVVVVVAVSVIIHFSVGFVVVRQTIIYGEKLSLLAHKRHTFLPRIEMQTPNEAEQTVLILCFIFFLRTHFDFQLRTEQKEEYEAYKLFICACEIQMLACSNVRVYKER